MMNKATAIARLRERGTLSPDVSPANRIARTDINHPIAQAAAKLASDTTRRRGGLLAPSLHHGVLP